MSFLNLRLAMRASVINQLKNVRYISYDALRHAEELEEIGLRINDRQYFLSLRSHKSVNFVPSDSFAQSVDHLPVIEEKVRVTIKHVIVQTLVDTVNQVLVNRADVLIL